MTKTQRKPWQNHKFQLLMCYFLETRHLPTTPYVQHVLGSFGHFQGTFEPYEKVIKYPYFTFRPGNVAQTVEIFLSFIDQLRVLGKICIKCSFSDVLIVVMPWLMQALHTVNVHKDRGHGTVEKSIFLTVCSACINLGITTLITPPPLPQTI